MRRAWLLALAVVPVAACGSSGTTNPTLSGDLATLRTANASHDYVAAAEALTRLKSDVSAQQRVGTLSAARAAQILGATNRVAADLAAVPVAAASPTSAPTPAAVTQAAVVPSTAAPTTHAPAAQKAPAPAPAPGKDKGKHKPGDKGGDG